MASTTTATPGTPSVFDDRKKLEHWKRQSVEMLMRIDRETPLSEEEKARHRSFLFLLMKLVVKNWNGNRQGVLGTYNHRDEQQTGSVWSYGKEYLGHNIAAMAVDGNNRVIDFDFNHNDLFKSTVEHAESRLVRRLFNLTGLRSSWSLGEPYDAESPSQKNRYATTLPDVTIYTTLEPCAQCAGIMALASIKKVVYLQQDDGAMRVVNVLYNLKPYGAGAEPVSAEECGVREAQELTESFEAFQGLVALTPFHVPDPEWQRSQKVNASKSLSTFLCTDYALRIFEGGAGKFDDLVKAALELPAGDPARQHAESLSAFLEYASKGGQRGTPH